MAQHRTCLRARTGWRAMGPAFGAMLLVSACAAKVGPSETARATDIPVFDGSETFLAKTSPLPQWTAVVARYDQAMKSRDRVPAEWRRLVKEISGLGLRAKIERVNAEINRYPYVSSTQNWGRPDYWETPFEFLAKNGQCQDYAATKYFLLRAAGVPASDLRIVVVQDSEAQLAHAVVVVDPYGEALLLDNQITNVVPLTVAHRYTPLYALNEEGWWAFKAQPRAPWLARYAQASN